MRLLSLAVLALLVGCSREEPRSVAITEIEAVAGSGYRGSVSVVGYYFFHPEEDVLFLDPVPEDPYAVTYDDPHVVLSLSPILKKEKITDWRARQKYMDPFHRNRVTMSGNLRKEPLQLGGPVTGGVPPVLTFVSVEKIEWANQRPDGTSAKAPPSKPSQGAAVPHP